MHWWHTIFKTFLKKNIRFIGVYWWCIPKSILWKLQIRLMLMHFIHFFVNKREYSFSEIVIENSTSMNKCVWGNLIIILGRTFRALCTWYHVEGDITYIIWLDLKWKKDILGTELCFIWVSGSKLSKVEFLNFWIYS